MTAVSPGLGKHLPGAGAHADEIFTEAENRLHVQKAVLAVLLAGKENMQ